MKRQLTEEEEYELYLQEISDEEREEARQAAISSDTFTSALSAEIAERWELETYGNIADWRTVREKVEQINEPKQSYASYLYVKKGYAKEQQRIDRITQQIRAREDFLAAQAAVIATNKEARMIRELEEYGLEQNRIYEQRAFAKKARLRKAERQKNEYLLRNHFIKVLNTK